MNLFTFIKAMYVCISQSGLKSHYLSSNVVSEIVHFLEYYFFYQVSFKYFRKLEALLKLLSYLKSTPSNLSICNMPKIAIEIALFGYFRDTTWRNYFHILNHLFQTCLFGKFGKTRKMPNSGTKSILFEFFWSTI